MRLTHNLAAAERSVALFTLFYVAVFTALFALRGNLEFLGYIATMAVLIALVARSLTWASYPHAMLWALSLWGLAHMAGGGIPVGNGVLYGVTLIPLMSDGEMTILKYDQLVHAFGFGITAWVLWHLLLRAHPSLAGSRAALVYPALAAMGLGAVNEIIEFAATIAFAETGVGGYVNTGLDLVFNALGALVAVTLIGRFAQPPSPTPAPS